MSVRRCNARRVAVASRLDAGLSPGSNVVVIIELCDALQRGAATRAEWETRTRTLRSLISLSVLLVVISSRQRAADALSWTEFVIDMPAAAIGILDRASEKRYLPNDRHHGRIRNDPPSQKVVQSAEAGVPRIYADEPAIGQTGIALSGRAGCRGPMLRRIAATPEVIDVRQEFSDRPEIRGIEGPRH